MTQPTSRSQHPDPPMATRARREGAHAAARGVLDTLLEAGTFPGDYRVRLPGSSFRVVLPHSFPVA